MIETPRLIIKDLQLEDALRFSEYRDKSEVARFQSWNRYPLKKAQKRIEQCLEKPICSKPGNYQLGIYLKDNEYLIGDFYIDIEGKKSFSLGYTIDSPYWGKGYGNEALQRLLEYMYQEYNLKLCTCRVYNDNYRSINLLLKNGFKEVSRSKFYQDILYSKRIDV